MAAGLSVSQEAQMRQFRIQAFISTWCCYAGFYFCRKAFYIAKGSLTTDLHLDSKTLAYVGTAYLIAYAIGEFNSAAVGSRVGARRLLLTGMAISLACNVVFGFANNVWTFMAFMALNGLAQATGWSGTIGTMAQWFHREERGQIMGIWSTCYQIGGAVASGFAAFMLGWLGWRWSFWGASIVLGSVWFLFYFLQHNKPEDVGLPPIEDGTPVPTDNTQPDASHLTQPSGFSAQLVITILMMGGFYFFVKFIRYALWSWAPYFLKLNYGLSDESAGYYSVTFDILGFLGVLTAGFVSDRVFKSRRTTVTLLMMIGLTLSTALMWWFIDLRSPALFAVILSMIGFMLYGPDSLMSGAGAIDVGSRKYALAAAGIINGMGSCGAVCQEFVIGYLYNKEDPNTLGPIFAALILSAGISTLMVFFLALRARAGKCNL
jgi:sugar phosphate permease